MRGTRMRVVGWVAAAVLALSASAALAGRPVARREMSGVVNLNTATAVQLDLLPGVGEKAAKRIIEHRAKAPFGKVDDLRKVKGFGVKKLDKLKVFLTTTGPTTLVVKKVKSEAKGPMEPGAAQPGQGRRAQQR